MAHDLLVWLLDLIRRGAAPIRTAAAPSYDEAIELDWEGRRFRIRVEEIR